MNERRSAQSAAALQSETTFRCASASMCVADATTRVIATNAAFDARVGHCRDRAIATLFVDPNERARAAAQLRMILEEGSSAVIRGECATSHVRLVLSWSCRVVDRFILAVVENVTDQLVAEDELSRKSQEFDALLRALPDVYFRLDRVGRIAAWHASRETEIHAPQSRFVGRRCEEVMPATVASTIASAVDRARADRAPLTVEYTLPTPGGDDQFEARVVPYGEGDVAAIIRNTTARRRAETALRASEERLRASQKMEAIGRLAGGVAHDFNNLLTVVLGQLQFLRRSATLTEADRAHVNEAFEATGHAVSLTRQLVAFSRGQVMQPRVFSLNTALSSIQDMLRHIVGEHIEIELSLDESAPAIDSDPTQIEQIILNLVLNARDAMPDGGTLTVSTRATCISEAEAAQREGARAGAYVALSVTDTGCGMRPEVMAHLFEPFFTTKSQGEGTGLGLATVYGIVQQSGGHTVVRSTPGFGSTFELRFPCAEGVRNPEVMGSSLAPAASPSPIGGGERILVVEDEDGLRRLVVEILDRAGYRVFSAANGDEAMRTILGDGVVPELLLTDVVMPRMNGGALAARAADACPAARVLLMSGHYDAQVNRRPAEGVERSLPILQKPFTEETLLRRIRDTLDGK